MKYERNRQKHGDFGLNEGGKQKEPPCKAVLFSSDFTWYLLQGTLHFAGTQTTGAGVDVTRRPCYNSLHTLDIGFPSPVASTMGMGNLDSESDTLTTDVALSHDAAPP